MKHYKIITTIFFVCLTAKINAENIQNQKQTIQRIPLLTANLETEKTLKKTDIKRIDFSPLQKTGLHTHPVPVVGYIAEGTIYFQIEGEEAKILKTGDAFFEPENVKILHFDNPSKINSARFIAFYLLGKDDKEIIKMLK